MSTPPKPEENRPVSPCDRLAVCYTPSDSAAPWLSWCPNHRPESAVPVPPDRQLRRVTVRLDVELLAVAADAGAAHVQAARVCDDALAVLGARVSLVSVTSLRARCASQARPGDG